MPADVGWQIAQSSKEGFYLTKQFRARWLQSKRSPLKKPDTEGFLQLRQLSTDRRLLNSVRHAPRCRADPAMLHDVIEKLEMMNVNAMIIAYIDV